jgi:hypothetical protein
MLFYILFFICGVVAGQELKSIPQLKPQIIKTYHKLFKEDAPSED